MTIAELGKIIRDTRKSKNLSQAKLAQQLGMSRATISALEQGTISEIGIRKVITLCSALGLEFTLQPKHRRPTLQQLLQENNHA